ncbi:MAG: bifunctional DNA-formamidopyrimidine glycosylase/DNA-(apurinic or apyrimidinic site) lyase [Burkholderiales bacterium]|nr:bifunctional DNA-formamidopyrimidine glycosylase/DNA-(apurinic or apyrimidinic site) lyase [Burkholderiales bacterium]
MPELPEVEATRRSFVDQIVGAHIVSVRMGKPLRWPLGCSVESLVGRRVLGVRRRGKYLLLDLDQGLLLVHLGMSGSLGFFKAQPHPGAHDHCDVHTTQGVLRLHDPRRFGAVVYAAGEAAPAAQKLLGKLGPEPLEAGFDLARFHATLCQRRVPIKQVLLAGDAVVGVGNIYASEALFRAGIRPTVKASNLSRRRAEVLYQAVREVLTQAVEKGGSTLRNFSNANGEVGHFQMQANVYARAGQPCRVCGTLIRLIRQGQRSTFFCPHCQKS